MKTGIVLSIANKKATLLQSDGAVVSARAINTWQIGDVVPIAVQKNKMPKQWATLAACVAVFTTISLGAVQVYASPTALISMDVNPSIELDINRFNRVVGVRALNEAGEEVLENLNIQSNHYEDAIATLLKSEGSYGYLNDTSNVVFTVFSDDPTVKSDVLEQLVAVMETTATDTAPALSAEYHGVDKHTVTSAHDEGVSAGKYIYLEQLQVLTPDVDVSQFKHHSITQLKDQLETHKEKEADKHETDGATDGATDGVTDDTDAMHADNKPDNH